MTTNRPGFTFIELLMVVVLGFMVLAAAYGTLVRQEQAYGQVRAMVGTQDDARMGIELLSAELREVSPEGGDLLMAAADAIGFRALRKFGLVCTTDKLNKRLVVARLGVDPFRAGDSVVVYVDGDTLMAADDSWARDVVTGVASPSLCTTTLGLGLSALLPDASLATLSLHGAGLKYDSIFPGAPVRSFEALTYRTGTWDGDPMLVVERNGTMQPLVGPLTATDGVRFRYFDGQGNELTGLPLGATDRERVRRVRVEVRATRHAGSRVGMHQDSLITDIYTRGS